jgi:hypothetical protein
MLANLVVGSATRRRDRFRRERGLQLVSQGSLLVPSERLAGSSTDARIRGRGALSAVKGVLSETALVHRWCFSGHETAL